MPNTLAAACSRNRRFPRRDLRHFLVAGLLVASTVQARADATYRPLPFVQNWTNTALLASNDVWSGVPGVVGFRGDGLTATTGVNPQTVLGNNSPGVVDINVNQSDPVAFTTGGITEFEVADPVVALAGGSPAAAPYLVFHLNTIGWYNIQVSYRLRDLESTGSTDDSVQPVALQFRTNAASAWTNVAAGFVADASDGPGLGKETNVAVTLPVAASGAATLQIRVITTDAAGNDEWVGVDDVSVTGQPEQFTYVTTGTLPALLGLNGSAGVAWGDFDGDGDLDLYQSRFGNVSANKLLRNEGEDVDWFDATTGPLGNIGNARAVAIGDFDNDGDLDIYLTNRTSPNHLFRNDGASWADATTPALADTGDTEGAAFLDYDLDGDLDLLVAKSNTPNRLFRNDSGTWLDVAPSVVASTSLGVSFSVADYDGDGDPDIYLVRNGAQHNQLIRNDLGSGWNAVGSVVNVTNSGDAGAWADYDNDGDLDLFVTSTSTNWLFRNDGGVFVNASNAVLGNSGFGSDATWGDYDNDGDLDLYLSNYAGANKLVRNDNGVWVNVTTPALANFYGASAAWADYDDDGDLDLFVSNQGEPSRLFQNQGTSPNHWLEASLQGVVSNRSALTAQITVVAGGVRRIRQIGVGAGGLSQNALVAHFGLGAATTIDSLVIRWPSGIVWDTAGVAIDQHLHLVEHAKGVLGVGTLDPSPAVELSPANPNPFTGPTHLSYAIPARSQVQITVLDLQGRRVASLASGVREPGRYSVTWDGRREDGARLKAGIYFVRLQTPAMFGTALTRKVVLTR